MKIELTARQEEERRAFQIFVRRVISPYADDYDEKEYTPPEIIWELAQQGYLGALAPSEYNGSDMNMVTFGLLSEELGRGCSSVRSLLTVHSMVIHALLRWGNKQQKANWLPQLATGSLIGAFGLSEPLAGSDAASVSTTARLDGEGYVLNGVKKWTTYGQIADLFLVFANLEGKVSAFLIERTSPGFEARPIKKILGTRASMLAELHLRDCRIPKSNLIGGRGFGLAAVATSCLDIGRYSVACGCVGLAQACLDASLAYTSERQQFGVYLKDHQLIQRLITDMLVNIKAARLLYLHAGQLKDQGDPDTIMETWVAKYFASQVASQAALDAVQIYGANGCSSDYPVQRYLRDLRVMEIIEGSTQIQQLQIARYAYERMEKNDGSLN